MYCELHLDIRGENNEIINGHCIALVNSLLDDGENLLDEIMIWQAER